MENKKIGSYTVVRLLGSGGMGQVYEAVHDQIQRRAAIKVLHKRYAHNRQIAQRFINEARATNIVQHPSLVSIYEFGQAADGSAFIVMEYLDGDTLRQRLERHGGRLPVAMAMRLCRQMAAALSAAHQKGIVHRDLKPVNIMIVADSEAAGGERAKVLDFGLAKVVLPETEAEGAGLTHTGTILGTPAYMAPEQCRSARAVDDKSDVYSLGVILYEMLSSDIPFDAETDAELLSMHMYKDPPPLLQRAPDVPPELAALVHRMLAKEQSERPSAGEVASELARLAQLGIGTAAASLPAAITTPLPAPAAAISGGAAALTIQVAAQDRETLVDAKAAAQRAAVPAAAKAVAAAPAPSPSPAVAAVAVAPARRGGLLMVGLILIVAAAAGGGVVGWQRGRQGQSLSSLLGWDGGAAADGAARMAPIAVPLVHFSIGSIPAGAEVLGDDGRRLGVTPLTVEAPRRSGQASYSVRLAGYVEARIELPLERDESRVVVLAVPPPLADAAAAGPSDGGWPTGSDAGATKAGPALPPDLATTGAPPDAN